MPDIRVKILVYQHDGTVVSQYLLGEGEHSIGRDPSSSVYAESEYISHEHAKLHLTPEGIFIEDLKSTSGTFLDNVAVRGKLRLNSGQRLQVGDLYIDLQMEGAGDLSPRAKIGAGRYQLVKELGRGAMGQVWLGQDTQLDEQVAIKVLNKEVANDAVSLVDLKREVQKSRKLSHDNIIRIHDLFQLPGESPFISLEFVEGTDLHAIRHNQPDQIFRWEKVKPYLLQLCEALDYAHERKIVHRDLKPANMMVNVEGVLKLADFGIAASMADAAGRSSMTDIISGTPQYMSPQQMLGEPPRASDDIYALGATMYDLLTGRPPFHTGDIAQQVHHVTPAPIDQRLAEFGLQNDVPEHINSVIMSCLAKDPGARPADAGAIAEWIRTEGKSDNPAKRRKTKTGIEQIIPADPAQVGASTPTPAESQPQATKGKKTPVLAIAAGIAVLLIAIGILFFGKDSKEQKKTKGGTGKNQAQQPATANDPLGKAIVQNNGDLIAGLKQLTKSNPDALTFDENGNLSGVEFYAFPDLTDDSLAHLKGPKVQNLKYINTRYNELLTDKCLPHIAKLPSIKRLIFGAISDDGLEYLVQEIPDLREIQLDGGRSNLTLKGLNKLSGFGKLELLLLSNFNLSNPANLDFLKDFPQLGWLNFYGGCFLTDLGVKVIAESCPGLKYLAFNVEKPGDFNLTDKALTDLKKLKLLRRLTFSAGFTFSEDAVTDLRKSLPNCEVTIKEGSATPDSLKKGLVAYYPFNGNAKDESGNGNDGEVQGATLVTDRHGNKQQAYSFDGKDDFINHGNHAEHTSSSFTISVWFYFRNLNPTMQSAIVSREDDINNAYILRVENRDGTTPGVDYLRLLVGTERGWAEKYTQIQKNVWHQVIATASSDKEMVWYLDGKNVDSRKIPAFKSTSSSNLHVGKQSNSTDYFDGIIDDIRIYNRALSVDEITALYDLEKPSSETASGIKKPGTLLWEFNTRSYVDSSPAIAVDGNVYIGTRDKKVYALDGRTGAKKWEFDLGRNMQDSSIAFGANGDAYIGTTSGEVWALKGKTGAKKWIFRTEDSVYSSPAIGIDGTIYFGSKDKKIYALNGETGIKQWEFETGDPVYSSPAVGSDGTVYVGSYDKNIYALDGKTGAKKWEFETGSTVYSSPAIGANGTVYCGSDDNKVYALDGKTGEKKWEFEAAGRVHGSPAIGADGTIYVGAVGKVYALDGNNGSKKWEFIAGGEVVSCPAIGTDGTIYIGSGKKVFALEGKTGAKKWEFETEGIVRSSSAIGTDGTIYVGSLDGKVYACASSSKGLAKSPWPMRGQNARHTGRASAILNSPKAAAALEAAIRKATRKPTGPLTSEDFTRITSLEIRGANIAEISPVAQLTSLQTLFLETNKVTSLLPLKNLTSLKGIYMSVNRVSDLSPLTRMSELASIYFTKNDIANIAPLSGLKSLRSIILPVNQISSLEPLASLSQVDKLVLYSNQISNLKPLAGMIALKILSLGRNKVTDVNPLAGLKNLEELNLDHNQLTDVNALAGLKRLEILGLSNNPNLTKAEVEKLQKALPNCKITHNATK